MASQDHQLHIVAIIGTGGMGLPIARRLALGKHVLLAGFSNDTLEEAVAALQKEGFSTESHKSA